MRRLILALQYPTPMRYQEWWWATFPKRFKGLYDEILVLGKDKVQSVMSFDNNGIAAINASIDFELVQMEEYMALELKEDDTLLLADISFPGMFPTLLFHKRPRKCIAICHATSINRYDYFYKERGVKWPIEKAYAKLFDKVFVATEYHRKKLNWNNVVVTPFPYPPFSGCVRPRKYTTLVSVARKSIQKLNYKTLSYVEKELHYPILTSTFTTWDDYYSFLASAKILLITAKEETYGYQVIDAIKNDCIPIAPNKYSYPELLPREYLYDTPQELVSIIKEVLIGRLGVPYLAVEYRAHNFYNSIAINTEE